MAVLDRHGILEPSLAQRLAPAAGLRNRLVHEYDATDDAMVLEGVARARTDFAQYLEAVNRYVATAAP